MTRVAGIWRAAAAAVALFSAGGAGASEPSPSQAPAAATEALAGNLIRLADGGIVRLAGIRVPADDGEQDGAERLAEQARAALGRLVEGQTVRLTPAMISHDRYRRLVAQVERDDGLWLQGALLEQGLVQVQTRPGEAARATDMLAREDGARAARRGLWARPGFMPQDASGLDAGSTGRFRIVQGRVLRVAPIDRYVYLNFGADWRSDFTVRVRHADLKSAFLGLDIETLSGRRIEVRGVVLEAGGPLIELSHLEQMRILP